LKLKERRDDCSKKKKTADDSLTVGLAQIAPVWLNREKTLADCPEMLANGGSCLAGPDGEWVIPPIVDREALAVATLEHRRVREERQNFDPAGHYARRVNVFRDRSSFSKDKFRRQTAPAEKRS
jgi:predicted amidohydrolase